MLLDDGKIYESVSVIVADISEERLKLAKNFGADIAVNVAQKPFEVM